MPHPSIAILIAQHPAINHAVILREVRLLRESLDVHTLSIAAPDRPPEKLSAEEREEAAQTFYVKPEGVSGAIRAHLTALVRHPGGYFRGWASVFRLGRVNPVRIPRLVAYLTEALIAGVWMERHGLGHLHTHYSSTVALLCRYVFPISISISFHGPDEFNDPVGFWLREKIEACDFVRAISFYARSQLMKCCDAAHWDKIHVVYMGVDPAVFSPRPAPAGSPVELLCVGRIAPVKAQHILVEAMARLAASGENVRLHLVGGGPDKESIAAAVIRRKLDTAVVVHGFMLQEHLDALYRRADVFVLPSFAEGVPGVLMEAMAMEIPCVATGITGVPELMENDRHGLLVAPSDIEGLTEALRRLIRDPGLRLRLGQESRRRILDRFHLPHNAAKLAGICKQYVHPPGDAHF